MTPPGRRASESFGKAVYDGRAQAVENITNPLSGENEEVGTTPAATTTTAEATQDCDGPHVGQF